jgi:hypothetical protein
MPLSNKNKNYCNITLSALTCFGSKCRLLPLVNYYSIFLNSEKEIYEILTLKCLHYYLRIEVLTAVFMKSSIL